jgi:hypothetical protein
VSGYPFFGHEIARLPAGKGWEARVVMVREGGRRVLLKRVFASWFEADEWGAREANLIRLCPCSSVDRAAAS